MAKKKICQETIRKSCLWPKHAHLPNVSINVSEQLILTRMVHTVYTQQNSELFTLVERAIWNLIMKKKMTATIEINHPWGNVQTLYW